MGLYFQFMEKNIQLQLLYKTHLITFKEGLLLICFLMADSCLCVCHVSSVQGLLPCNIKLIFMTDYTRLYGSSQNKLKMCFKKIIYFEWCDLMIGVWIVESRYGNNTQAQTIICLQMYKRECRMLNSLAIIQIKVPLIHTGPVSQHDTTIASEFPRSRPCLGELKFANLIKNARPCTGSAGTQRIKRCFGDSCSWF